MEYRAAGNLCAVDFDALHLQMSSREALDRARSIGYEVYENPEGNPDPIPRLIKSAQYHIGKSKYHRGANPHDAPEIVDCSSFTRWLYATVGIWLPRRSVQQREYGEIIPLDEVIAGDLIFLIGRNNWHLSHRTDGVGHVGIVTNEKTVIHATNQEGGVVETPLAEFVDKDKFRGARRYIPQGHLVVTLTTRFGYPPDILEVSSDIKWIILQSL